MVCYIQRYWRVSVAEAIKRVEYSTVTAVYCSLNVISSRGKMSLKCLYFFLLVSLAVKSTMNMSLLKRFKQRHIQVP